MIAVLADDFAGAAELAGIGFARGLASEVHTAPDIPTAADLVTIDTDSRSCPALQSAERVADAIRVLGQRGPAWLFKKVDSVLRGPVLSELRAMLAATGKRRAILAPANPSRGRIVRDGKYFVEGRPIHQTSFAADPEHPVRSANVLEMLGPDRGDVCVLRPKDDLPDRGIIVGEASTSADLAFWAGQIDESTLPAGAADFFAALLQARPAVAALCARPAVAALGVRPAVAGLCSGSPAEGMASTVGNALRGVPGPAAEASSAVHGTPRRAFPTDDKGYRETLFVCGSAAAWTSERSQQCAEHGIPALLLGAAHPDAAIAALAQHGVAMVALGSPPGALAAVPRSLLEQLIEAVAQLLGQRPVGRLFVEGGGTASALVRRMGWTSGRVCRQYAPGVVAVQVNARPPVTVTIKPGSYPWPDEVWRP